MVNCFDMDLEKGQHCGRSPCAPCDSSDKRENCRSRILVYESKCRVCKPVSSQAEEADNQSSKNSSPREGIYVGETSRSLHERSIEHMRDAESFSAKSHIVKHWMKTYANLPTPPQMIFSITSRYRDCLSRQIAEALRINYSKDIILNSKGEYLSNTISRLSIEEDAWERRERCRIEEEEDKMNKVWKFLITISDFLITNMDGNVKRGGVSKLIKMIQIKYPTMNAAKAHVYIEKARKLMGVL